MIMKHPCGDCAMFGDDDCMKNRFDCDYADFGEVDIVDDVRKV